MTTYDLRKKTDASTGQKINPLGGGTNPAFVKRVTELEQQVASQYEKLNQIVAMLNELSKSKSTS